jgi:hypothetical protein
VEAGEVVPVEGVGVAVDESDEVELAGEGESIDVDALCEVVGNDEAFGGSADVVMALSGLSR